MGRLQDKVIIITGAGSGMGAVATRLFAAEGAQVVATDIQEEAVTALCAELSQDGLQATAMKLDVTSEPQWQEVAGNIMQLHGRIDVLVNNAGLPGAPESWETVTLESFNKVVNLNLNSQFLGIKTVSPHMAAGSSIVNLSSIAGLVALPEVHPAYSPSKGANRLLTKSAAASLAEQGIRVNSIHPGLISTPQTEFMNTESAAADYFLGHIPMKRLGRPEEVANVMLFLASDDSSYMTGSELIVDGGYTAK